MCEWGWRKKGLLGLGSSIASKPTNPITFQARFQYYRVDHVTLIAFSNGTNRDTPFGSMGGKLHQYLTGPYLGSFISMGRIDHASYHFKWE